MWSGDARNERVMFAFRLRKVCASVACNLCDLLRSHRMWVSWGWGGGGGGEVDLPIMDYTGGGGLPLRGTFFRREVYKRVGISRVEIYETESGKLSFSSVKRA